MRAFEAESGGKVPIVWFDRCCIDQRGDIEAQLTSLPVFLAGCKSLLVLLGPTYTQRLWCVLEVFMFIRIKDVGASGGSSDQLVIKLLGDMTDLAQSLSRFDAAKAQCRYDRDRQRLLAVIEASFGTAAPFNQLVLEVLNRRLLGVKDGSPSRRGKLSLSKKDVQMQMSV